MKELDIEVTVKGYRELGTNKDGSSVLKTDTGVTITFTPEATQELVNHLLTAAKLHICAVVNPGYAVGTHNYITKK